MGKGRHIHAVGGDDGTPEAQTSNVVDGEAIKEDADISEGVEAPAWDEDWEEPAGARRLWPTLLATVFVVLALAWTGAFVWVHRASMAFSSSLDQWTTWIGQWAGPLLLLAIAWLIAMRSSAREANRFGDAARVLAQESALLEARLVTVNRELSLAREFLSAQSRELDYLGRAAAERISEHAGKLQELVANNGAQVDAIAGVSVTALENMAQLRDHLPVVANSARDVTNQIGGAGRTAKAQLGELVSGFERLNEFGQASERQVASLRDRVEETLDHLRSVANEIDDANAERVAALRQDTEALRTDLDAREKDALAAMHERVEALTRQAIEAAATIRAGEQTALSAWEGQIDDLRSRLETALAEIAALDNQALQRAHEKLGALTEEAKNVDARMLERDREFQDRVAARNAAFDEADEAALVRITERGEQLDRELTARYDAQIAQVTVLRESADTLAARVAEIGGHIAAIADRGSEAETSLTGNAATFAKTVKAHAGELEEAEGALSRLTDASVRLLELIQATAKHSRDQLPTAIEGFETELANARIESDAIRDTLAEARGLSGDLNDTLGTIQGTGKTVMDDLEAFRERLAGTAEEQSFALGELREQFGAVGEENRTLAEGISGLLTDAVARVRHEGQSAIADFERSHAAAIEGLREKLAQATNEERDNLEKAIETMADGLAKLRAAGSALFGELEAGHDERVAALAERMGDDSARAIDRAIEARTRDSIARLDEATAQSTDAASQAVAHMRDQLARVHELTVNLESRAARAREQVEEQVDGDFSRRVALITESLNSHSIDIAKALSTEVTDTAWASYLKGDRGIFTRRAVRLIDNSEAREISDLYESDHEFREHVSRYIHDFEAMLRTMLSTRDGHALGVTLLSSDMGKLYVALAQAIQRLRQ